MIQKDIELDAWYHLDSYVRKLNSDWASLMFEALKLDHDKDTRRYKELAIAAQTSSSDFFQQWKKSIGDVSKHADIAADLKNESSRFREPRTLIEHAMLATKSELLYGKRALKTAESYGDYEDVVSDFLEQAQVLLESKTVHPASPAVLIGARLLRSFSEHGLKMMIFL